MRSLFRNVRRLRRFLKWLLIFLKCLLILKNRLSTDESRYFFDGGIPAAYRRHTFLHWCAAFNIHKYR